MAKKGTENIRYIGVKGVPNQLLDFLFVYRFTKDELIQSGKVETKLKRKLMTMKASELSVEELRAHFSTFLYDNFYTYNLLVQMTIDVMEQFGEDLFELLTNGNFDENISHALANYETFAEKLGYLNETVELFRFYKKGKYADTYIPTIFHLIQQEMPEFVALFEGEFDEQSIGKLVEMTTFELEKEAEEAFSAERLKEEMNKLLERFTNENHMVNAEVLDKLRAQLDGKEKELKSIQKQLKNKEDQHSKLQKENATLTKDIATLKDKASELKRQESTKTQEVSKAKKEASEAKEKLAVLETRLDQSRQTLQKELMKAREEATKPLQIKVIDLQQQLEDVEYEHEVKAKKLEQSLLQMQQTLTEERGQREQLEDEVARMRQFQQVYNESSAKEQQLLQEQARLRDENGQLLAKQSSYERQIQLLEQLLTEKNNSGMAVERSAALVTPAPVPVSRIEPVSAPTSIDPLVMPIDDDIFAAISNEPIADDEVGTIQVVKDENEIDFASLLDNIPE